MGQKKRNSHLANGGMRNCATDLDRNNEIHSTYSAFEGLEGNIFVREHTVRTCIVAEAHAGRNVVSVRAEPCVALGLFEDIVQ